MIDDVQLEQTFADVVNKVLTEPKLIDIRNQNQELTAQYKSVVDMKGNVTEYTYDKSNRSCFYHWDAYP